MILTTSRGRAESFIPGQAGGTGGKVSLPGQAGSETPG